MTLTLRDQVKKAQQQKEEEAQEANPYSNPVSPGALQTTNPDVQKMGGTPNQTQSALESAVTVETTTKDQPQAVSAVEQSQQVAAGSSTDLDEAKSQQEFAHDAATEKAAQWSENMKGFGSLGSRVEALIMDQVAGTGSDAMTAATFELDDKLIAEFAAPGAGNKAAIKDAMGAFQSAATQEEAFNALSSASQYFKDPSADLMNFIKQAYKNDPASQNEMVARSIADNVINPEELTVQQLVDTGMLTIDESGVINELGLTEDEVATMVGDDWNTLTPEDIQKRLGDFQKEELGKSEAIMEQLADPNLDNATRATLINEMKRLGQIGELQAEQMAEQSLRAAADAGKLVIDGQVKDVTELLSDESIKADVESYLMGGDDAEQWKENNSEFAAWIDREMGNLKGQSEELDTRLAEFEEIQQENERFRSENIADEAGGAAINDELMEALGFGGEGFASETLDPTSSEIYQELVNIDSSDTTNKAVKALNQLPESALEDLKGEFLTSAGGAKSLVNILAHPEHSKNLIRALEMEEKLEVADSPKDMIKAITGHGPDNVQAVMHNLRLNAALGDKASGDQLAILTNMFDADGNGKIDTDPQMLASNIKKTLYGVDAQGATKGASLAELVKGGMGDIGNAFSSADTNRYRGTDSVAHRALAGAAQDGIITPDELADVGSSMNPVVGLEFYKKMAKNPELMKGMGIDQNTMNNQLTNAAQRTIDEGTLPVKGRKLANYVKYSDTAAGMMGRKEERRQAVDSWKEAQKMLAAAETPQEKAVYQKLVNDLDKATRMVHVGSWSKKLDEAKRFQSRKYKPEELKAAMPFASSLIDKAFTKNADGSYTLPKLKGNDRAQDMVNFLLAAEAKGILPAHQWELNTSGLSSFKAPRISSGTL